MSAPNAGKPQAQEQLVIYFYKQAFLLYQLQITSSFVQDKKKNYQKELKACLL
jgi:hypothetical protein